MNLNQFIEFVISFLLIFRDLITYLIIARIIVSWFSMGRRPQGRIVYFLQDVTEPVINIARKIPHKIGMFDFAPLIALIGLDLFVRVVIIMLTNLAQ